MIRSALVSFFCLLTSLLTATPVSAAEVAVSAKVALSPVHIRSIKQNTRLVTTVTNDAVVLADQTNYMAFSISGTKDLPIKSKPVTVIAQSNSTQKRISLTGITDANGHIRFELPLTYIFKDPQYELTAKLHYEGTEIELVSTSKFAVKRPQILPQKVAEKSSTKIRLFPQDNCCSFTYPKPLIFATLNMVQKTDDFVYKNLEIPAANSAAARDGPVV